MSGLKAHYDEYGAKFLWVLCDGANASQAYSYFNAFGADFGWFTSDEDNSLSEKLLAASPMVEGVPWVLVIDGESMELLYNNPTSVYSITRDLATD